MDTQVLQTLVIALVETVLCIFALVLTVRKGDL